MDSPFGLANGCGDNANAPAYEMMFTVSFHLYLRNKRQGTERFRRDVTLRFTDLYSSVATSPNQRVFEATGPIGLAPLFELQCESLEFGVIVAYRRDKKKESIDLPGWLKFLSVLVLVLAGSSTIASAHPGHEDGQSVAWNYAAENQNSDLGTATDFSKQALFIENSDYVPGVGPCTGACCCCQGMTHCGPSGCSLSALNAHALLFFDPHGTQTAVFEDQLPPNARRVTGVERPPKA